MLNDRYLDVVPVPCKLSYTSYMKGEPIHAYSSHQPVLIHMLNTITEGDVMEFGMGDHSTPIMHIICAMQDRNLLSIDTNKIWFRKFTRYIYGKHTAYYIPTKVLLEEPLECYKGKYSIIFVDGAPAEIRQPFIEKVQNAADYIIVHDSESVPGGWDDAYHYNFSMFKHALHFHGGLAPGTSVLSNLDEIDERIYSIFVTQ